MSRAMKLIAIQAEEIARLKQQLAAAEREQEWLNSLLARQRSVLTIYTQMWAEVAEDMKALRDIAYARYELRAPEDFAI